MLRRHCFHSHRSRPWLAVCLLSLSPLSAQASGAGAPAPNYTQALSLHSLLHWKRMPVCVYFVPGAASTKPRREQVRAGFDEWVQATDRVITYRVVDAPSRADISVTLDEAPFLVEQTRQTGNTRLTFFGQVLKEADVELAAGDTTPHQLQELAAHEFGHALGIDGHSDDPNDLMAPSEVRVYDPYGDPIEAPAHPVTVRDLNTLKVGYGSLFAQAPRVKLVSQDDDPDSETIEPPRSFR